MNTINSFKGEYNFLSNFYLNEILYEGIIYPCAETAFQAAKCADKKDKQKFYLLQPAEAKKEGKKINLRPDWETVKVDIMREIIRIKFSNNADLRTKLLKIGDAELIEGNNWHDNFWGDCSCEHCKNITGENMLGNLLMEYRASIQNTPEPGVDFNNGFTCLSRQDYGADYIKKYMEPQGYVDEVNLGIDKEGGCIKGEAFMRWVKLDNQICPRFEVFTDGFDILCYLIRLPEFIDFVKTNPDFTSDDFSRFLIKHGFIDYSDKKLGK